MSSEVFAALDRWLKTQNVPTLSQGVVMSIAPDGGTASVRIAGSTTVQEVLYTVGANLIVGDTCVLMRTNSTSRWIIVGGFSPSRSEVQESLIDPITDAEDPTTPIVPASDYVVLPTRGSYDNLQTPASHRSPDGTLVNYPFTRLSGGLGRPLTPDAERRQSFLEPQSGHEVFQIAFNNASAVNSGFISVLNAPYTFKVSGSAKVEDGSASYNFLTGEHGWAALNDDPYYGPGAVYYAGEGYGRSPSITIVCRIILNVPSAITSVTVTWNGSQYGNINLYSNNFVGYPTAQASGSYLNGDVWTISGFSFTGGIGVEVAGIFPYSLPGNRRLTGITLGGAGGSPLYADAFYQWNLDSYGNAINVAPRVGLKIDGVAPVVTARNPSGEYTFTRTGTGNTFGVVYYDTDYAGNGAGRISIDIAGTGAGA